MSSIKLKHSGGNSVSLNPPTSAPTSSDVAFKLPNADGSAGQYMKTDGSGNLSFTTIDTSISANSVGITELNVADVASSGADTFVAGSAIFSKADYKIIIDEFRKKLNNVSI